VRSHAKAKAARPTLPFRRLNLVAVIAALVGALLAVPAQASPYHAYVGQFGGFSGNQGVAVDISSGNLFVADLYNGQVKELTSSGDPVTQFGGLTGPVGVAVDPANDRTYVTEQWANAVQVFETSTGSSLGYLETGSGWGAVNSVAVDAANGTVYVTDSAANLVQVFDATGAHLGSFGTVGSEPGEFSGPSSVAVDPTSHDVYVLDSGNGRVERFSAEGVSYLETLSGVNGPLAIAVDPANGDVYVGESSPSTQVARYDSSGARLYAFGSGRLEAIAGLATSATTHRVYVSDPPASAVKIFAPVTAATVTTGGASGITATQATFEGTINPEGTTVNYEYFQFGLDTSYGAELGGEQYGLTGTSDIPISVQTPPWFPLQPNATYHYRLVAETSFGPFYGEDETFATEPVPPAVDDPANEVTGPTFAEAEATTATLHAEVNPNNSPTTYHFEYGTSESYGSSTSEESAGAGYGFADAFAAISGLQPDTVYHYRVVADNGVGAPVTGDDDTFKTAPAAQPTAADVGADHATLSGIADVAGSGTYHFEYGPDSSYGQVTPEKVAPSQSGDQALSAAIDSLEPGTTYHFRLVSSAGGNTTRTPDGTFTTLPRAAVVTGEASDVGTTSATLHGTVDTQGYPGTYQFVVTGIGNSVKRETAPQPVTSSSPVSVSAAIADLPDGARYQVALAATVGGVTTFGEPTEFETAKAQTVTPRQIDISSPYGCLNPHLDSPRRAGRAGRLYTVTGSDLGVAGHVSIAGLGQRRGRSWSAGAVTFAVPPTAKRSIAVSIDCGQLSNTVRLRIKHPRHHKRAAHAPRKAAG
jgi:DNA-binding beta-propeller fold protein YncE